MYDNIYQTNKHAFRDGFVVGVIATITTAIVVTQLAKRDAKIQEHESFEASLK